MKKELSLFLFCVVLSLLLSSQIIRVVNKNAFHSERWLNQRYQGAVAAFDRYAPEKMILFIGASELESGFNPEVFDKRLRKFGISDVALNFGFRNLGPIALEALINELEYQLKNKNKSHIKSIYFKINPAHLTKMAAMRSKPSESEVLANIYSNDYLLSQVNIKNLRLLYIKNFQGGFQASSLIESIRSVLMQFFDSEFGTESVYGNDLETPRRKLWVSPLYNESPAWDPNKNGFNDWGGLGTKTQVRKLMSLQSMPAALEANIEWHEQKSDIINLDFDQELVRLLKTQIVRLGGLADNITVFYFPENPVLNRPPEVKGKLDFLITDLCTLKKVHCLRFDKGGFYTQEDYYDVHHLTPEAVTRLSDYLAADFLKAKQGAEHQ